MTFRMALGCSIGLHAALLAGPFLTTPPAFDVERAQTSVELYLAAPQPPAPVQVPATAALPPELEPKSSETSMDEPVAQTLVSEERRGAHLEQLPSYFRNPPPVYPRAAREQGEEGTVVVEARVLSSGRCGQVNVIGSSGFPLLDEAAVRAVRAWVFRPATRWRKPVAFWVEIPITFRLIDSSR